MMTVCNDHKDQILISFCETCNTAVWYDARFLSAIFTDLSRFSRDCAFSHLKGKHSGHSVSSRLHRLSSIRRAPSVQQPSLFLCVRCLAAGSGRQLRAPSRCAARVRTQPVRAQVCRLSTVFLDSCYCLFSSHRCVCAAALAGC
jgi:hypothetical protein